MKTRRFNVMDRLSTHPWSPFSSLRNLAFLAIGILAITLVIYDSLDAFSPIVLANESFELKATSRWLAFFRSAIPSFAAAVIFFIIFTFSLSLLMRRLDLETRAKSIFQSIRESGDFNCPAPVRKMYEEDISKLGAYVENFSIKLDLISIDKSDPEKITCDLEVLIEGKVKNISKKDAYHDTKKSIFNPNPTHTHEACKIVGSSIAKLHEELDHNEKSLDPKDVKLEDGKLIYEEALNIPAGKFLWTRGRYRQIWPMRRPGRTFREPDKHRFTSSRIAENLILEARNPLEEKCTIVIESTKLAEAKRVELGPRGGKFETICEFPLVASHDTGALKVHFEIDAEEETEITEN